uniref:Ammonium transporter n=1 Tax=Mantoniella antarctica TaxID=81844 RepID=A0A7S0X4C6_9CHLO|mmetsp:Transcript_17490/g.43337  ORF Transcript_17490/g.43337 Transcript_17490/m.43337 type:complete len:475 (+) Transcript_17490:206-1630(+)|eukprot:CAMPEP_0181370514 /NCGR_PEP_ID=MMETSP1106-20121128/13468_1 /TAXON_ID=81844 /ORGANISM="Mantoniella antarctica, Strain SL-175" /LENGTH=474 /DNA_ID=CAMNT_0023487315 /DNA_START=206 /DNA_END=1630 /DNA_ORIENTATION=-
MADPAPTLASLAAELTRLKADAAVQSGQLDILWLLFGAYLVFFMQCGFAMLEAGSVRAKNTKNILLKNLLDACLGGLLWWFIGYPLALGDPGAGEQKLIGGSGFFMEDRISGQNAKPEYYAMWMFQWAFAATAATIVSGAVAERCAFSAYLTYTTTLTAFIYPVVVHWVWSSEGWLTAWTPPGKDPYMGANGLIDFAGSGVVHMTGGGAALMGAIFLGPRVGRFASRTGEVQDMPGHSTVLAALGTFILWFGWYGFNPVSTLKFVYMQDAARCAVTTTLAACAGGCTTLGIHVLLKNPPDVTPVLNGILAGLVSITGPCAVVDPWAAAFIGFLGGFVYYSSSQLLLKLRIDDPLDAAPVHFFCGAWGVLAAGLFANKEFTGGVYGKAADDYGALFGGGAKQFGVQLAGVLVIALWTCSMSGLTFFGLKTLKMLRVSPQDEAEGLDASHHGGGAYNFEKPAGATKVAGALAQIGV